MKSKFLLFVLPVLLSGCIGWGIDDDSPVMPHSNYEAQVMGREVFESSVQLMPAREVENAGKIYIQDDFLIVNDVNKGFHIYDYSNPNQPTPIAFLNIPGATDVAIRESTVYINQAVDLVTIEYDSGSNAIVIKDRDRNVFPQKIAPDGGFISVDEDEIIVNWTLAN